MFAIALQWALLSTSAWRRLAMTEEIETGLRVVELVERGRASIHKDDEGKRSVKWRETVVVERTAPAHFGVDARRLSAQLNGGRS